MKTRRNVRLQSVRRKQASVRRKQASVGRKQASVRRKQASVGRKSVRRRALFRQRSARRHTRKVLGGGEKHFDGTAKEIAGGFKKDFMLDTEKLVLHMTEKNLIEKVYNFFTDLTLMNVLVYLAEEKGKKFIRVKIFPSPASKEKFRFELQLNKMKIGDFLDNHYADPSELKQQSAAPVSAAPVSAAPVSAAPVSAAPVSAAPVSAAPVRSAVQRFSSAVPGSFVNESSSDPKTLSREHEANTTIRVMFHLTDGQLANSTFLASNLLRHIKAYILQTANTTTFKKYFNITGLNRVPGDLEVFGMLDKTNKTLKIKLTSKQFEIHPNLKIIFTLALQDLKFNDMFTIITPTLQTWITSENLYV